MTDPNETALVPTVEPEAPAPTSLTSAQGKIDAIASLTTVAYAKASELILALEESAALQADFPNEAFRTGAGGKENLIYLEHSALRDRLTKVLGMGQWAIIARSRWSEEFEYLKDKRMVRACRVYVEAMLLVRGYYVAESIGDMVYYPANQGMNFGDAVEGAQSEALRRCCKNFGIGLQAWSKDFSERWWEWKYTKDNAATPKPPNVVLPPIAPISAARSSALRKNMRIAPTPPGPPREGVTAPDEIPCPPAPKPPDKGPQERVDRLIALCDETHTDVEEIEKWAGVTSMFDISHDNCEKAIKRLIDKAQEQLEKKGKPK